ncbi:MAG: PSD1 and planctomycete cytochrome C domain-containing protein [Planctomycetaceae bacterium]
MPAIIAAETVDFTTQIQPLLADRCLRCHGPEKQEGGLRLDLRDRALTGGDTGVAFTPGKVDESPLLDRIGRLDPDKAMPPEGEGTPLSKDEIELFRTWIEQGADWPNDVDSAIRSKHWAFQPIVRPAVPVLGTDHPVDAFIRSRLETEKLVPSPDADRATLLRRLSFDLLGLPPTADELEDFLNDNDPLAYERLVDRLLASPHYGERWGKHWLDLARYADTDGYSGEQYRPWAWRWRHWVIESLNADLPFDRFTIEQLAGDLISEATIEQRIATGFHRNYLHTREMDADKEEFRVRKIVDCANVTGSTWMGLTFGCAECHTHKFDPITQREYYGLYAFFNSTEEVDLPAPLLTNTFLLATSANTALTPTPATTNPDAAPKEPSPPLEIQAQMLAELAQSRPTHIHLRGNFLAKGPAVEPHTPAVFPPLRFNGERPTRLDLASWLVAPEHPLTSRVVANRIWQHLFGRGLVRTENDFGTQGTPPTHPELLDWLASEFMARGWSQKNLIRLIVTSATYKQSAALRPDLVERDPDNRLLARQNRLRHDAEILRDAALSAAGLLDLRIGGPSFRPPVPPDAGAVVSTQWKSDPTPNRYRRGLYIVVQRTIPLPYLMTFDAPDGNAFCTRRDRSNTPTQALTLLNDPMFFECARQLSHRLLHAQRDDDQRLALVFVLALNRFPSADEASGLRHYLAEQRKQLLAQPELAAAIAGIDSSTTSAQCIQDIALWTCVARVLMNTDEFISRE